MSSEKERPIDLDNSESENAQGNGHIDQVDEPQEITEPAAPTETDYQEQIQQLKLELDEYKDLFLRKAADFENFKKRKQQETAAIALSTEEAVITQLLSVLDDFDRLFATAEEEGMDRDTPFLRGARLIYDKLMALLTARGLKPLESVGQPFDPQLHEAVMQQPQSGVEAGVVLQEYTRGWRLGDRIIRHAKVVVSS